jgi:hypothetical protein
VKEFLQCAQLISSLATLGAIIYLGFWLRNIDQIWNKNYAESYLRATCHGLFKLKQPSPDGIVAEVWGNKMRIVSYKIQADNQSEIDQILLMGWLRAKTNFRR